MVRRVSRLLGAASVVALSSFGVQAQEVELDPISIFATAGSVLAFDFPGQVSVVEKDQIEDLQATRSADVFKGVPGVEFAGGPRQTGQVPTIRGFEGEGVVVLFDDARQNFVAGHDGRFFIDPDILTAAEVVKGPTSSLYGSGAIGGVMAFRTINASDILGEGENAAVRVRTGYQSVNDEQSYAITGVQRSDDGWIDLVSHFGYRSSGDIELGSGAILPADEDLNNALLKGTFNLSESLKWTTSWTYFNLDALDPQNPQAIGGSSNPLVDRKIVSSTLQTKFEYNPLDNDLIDLRVLGYKTNNEVEEPEILQSRVTSREVETLGFKIDNRSRFNMDGMGDLKLTYGTDFYRDEQTGTDSDNADGTRGGVPNATSDFFGLFAQAEFNFGTPGENLGQLTVIPGIRYDKFTSESDLGTSMDQDAVSPKIAVAYNPVEWFGLFGNYGKAFRAPSYNEAYSVGNHFVIPLPGGNAVNEFIVNPDLRPEEALGWELGATFKFDGVLVAGDRFRLKGSYWQNEVDNLINLDVHADFAALPAGCFGAPFPPCVTGAAIGWTSQHVNVASADLDGAEIEATYDNQWFAVRATYAQIEGRDRDTGEFVGALYPNKFFVDAAYKLPEIDARIGARATFAGEFDMVNDPSERRDAYQTVDLYAVWEPTNAALRGLRLDVGVDNVFDEDYELVFANVSEEGRNYKVGMSYRLPICGTSFCRNGETGMK